jgi:hypothetical protein
MDKEDDNDDDDVFEIFLFRLVFFMFFYAEIPPPANLAPLGFQYITTWAERRPCHHPKFYKLCLA